jgi:hypothetical protein
MSLTPVPAAPPATPASRAAPRVAASGLPLGGNLQRMDEFNPGHGLADLVKASSGLHFYSGGAKTDANGWPLADFSVTLWAAGTVAPGVYSVSFTGPAGTTVSTQGGGKLTKTGYNAATATHTYALSVGAGTPWLGLKFTNTGGQVKNLHVLQPGNPAGAIWSAQYLRLLQSLKPDTLRMMDIVDMNSNQSANWSDRPKPTDATYSRDGVSWEDLIQLCNQVGSNIWVCVPVRATDDYVRQLATLLKNTLNPGLKIYVEYSNEVWNDAFDQGQYNLAQAKSEVARGGSNLKYDGSGNQYEWADRRTARRLMEISNIFKAVWTGAGQPSPINGRVRCVLGNQAAQSSRVDTMLKYIADNYGAPKNFFWGVGVALYFQLNKYSDKPQAGGKFTALTTNLTADQALEGMNLSVSAYEQERRFALQLSHAAPYGLHLDAYELGVDTMGPLNIAAKKAANLDARIIPLMKRFVNAFYNQGGDEANWFQLGAGSYDTRFGTWPVTDTIGNINAPKAQAFRSLRGLAGLA